jgi:hypothetical protein
VERPKIKDAAVLAYVEHLEIQLNKFLKSPYAPTYMAILKQIEDWNAQLQKNKIDLFADKDAKEFDRSWKYFMEAVEVLERLDKMRKLMTPEETKEADKLLKDKNIGLAEQMALKVAK